MLILTLFTHLFCVFIYNYTYVELLQSLRLEIHDSGLFFEPEPRRSQNNLFVILDKNAKNFMMKLCWSRINFVSWEIKVIFKTYSSHSCFSKISCIGYFRTVLRITKWGYQLDAFVCKKQFLRGFQSCVNHKHRSRHRRCLGLQLYQKETPT